MHEPITYVWVPVDMTEDAFELLVIKARAAYDKAGKDYEAMEPPPNVDYPRYERYPDKKVSEVMAIYEEQQAALDRWRKIKAEAQKDFGYHLQAVSGGGVKAFYSQTPAVTVELDWGHRHGQDIAYSATELHDLPGSVEREEELW